MNEILVSKDSFQENTIVSGNVLMVQSLDCNELQYDTLDATLDLGGMIPTLFKPKDADGLLTTENELFGVRPLIRILVTDPTLYKYGEEVIYRHNGVLVGKYYMTNLTRVGKTQYKITCVSAVGLLANSQHYGGIYSGITFSDLVTEIIGGVVPFSVAPELKAQPVYGWLPIASRRENLHQALFAMGAAAQKDENGELIFKPLSDETHTEIPESRIYTRGSVSYPDAVTKVSISEHTYVANEIEEVVTLFEGLVAYEQITTPIGNVAQGTVVIFSDPMHDLVVENGKILESGVNYAVLAPASECKLVGQKYTHTIRQVTRPETADGGDTGAENKITVADATLVSVANSENVADRLMSYYSSAKTVSNDIVVDGERAGSAVQLVDPFGDVTKGIIKSLDITMSNTLKAHAEIVADYSPTGAGNFYTDLVILSEDGFWTVPDGVEKIRVVLIGGGSGGYSGAQGEPGADGQEFTSGSGTGGNWGEWGAGGKGGSKGLGGSGGRILVLSLNVEEGQTFSFTIGQGGLGGVCSETENTPGTDGTDTTFGDYSSADGTRSATGYVDLFGSTAYGIPGNSGVNGSDGDGGGDGSAPESIGDSITIGGVTYVSGARGETVTGSYTNSSGYTERVVFAGGGNGGGAAAGANGGDGEDGQTLASSTQSVANCGPGGTGATSTIPGDDALVFGQGGHGGNGGGGGGGGGSGWGYEAGTYIIAGKGGPGGLGSNGGKGAQGCVLIYY